MLMDIMHTTKANNKLGIITTNPKVIKKGPKESKKQGRKTTLQRITNLGTFLMELGQYSHLTKFFPLNSTFNQ